MQPQQYHQPQVNPQSVRQPVQNQTGQHAPVHQQGNVHSMPGQQQDRSKEEQARFNANKAKSQIKFITNGAMDVNIERTPKGIPTIGFQMAKIIKKDGNRQGDWANSKIMFQLNPDHELLQFIHAVIRKVDISKMQYGLQFKFHGAANDKQLTLRTNDDGSLTVQVMQRNGSNVSATIQPTGVAHVLTLAYKAYAARYDLTVSEAMNIIHIMPPTELPK